MTPTPNAYGTYRHQPDGEIYVLKMAYDPSATPAPGTPWLTVLAVVGPLHYRDLQDDPREYDFQTEDTDWAQTELEAAHFAPFI